MFNIIHVAESVKADDVCFAGSRIDEGRLLRAKRVELLPGLIARLAAPEDVILSKLQFFKQGQSDKHLRDSAQVLIIMGDRIDLAFLDHWSLRIGVSAEWKVLRQRVEDSQRKPNF